MKTRACAKRLIWLVLVLPLCAFAASSDFLEQATKPQHLVAPASITLEQAADQVRRETGGRVLSVAPTERAGRRGYDVRVLLGGKRVRKVFVDAPKKR